MGGFPSMCAVCSTSLRTSVKSRNSTNWLLRSEAGKSQHPSSCSPRASSRPSTRTRRTRLSATATVRSSSAARKNPLWRNSVKSSERRQSTYITHQKPVRPTTHTAWTIRRPASSSCRRTKSLSWTAANVFCSLEAWDLFSVTSTTLRSIQNTKCCPTTISATPLTSRNTVLTSW